MAEDTGQLTVQSGSTRYAVAAAIPAASKHLHLVCEAENEVVIDIELCFDQGETAETGKVFSGTITWPGSGTVRLIAAGAGEGSAR